jgi:hypothetical protein
MRGGRRKRSIVALIGIAMGAGAAALTFGCAHSATAPAPATTSPPPIASTAPPALRVVAQAVLPTGTTFAGHEVGGLSGLAYDARSGLFYAVSDDASGRPPARVLRFRWQPPAGPELVDWLPLADEAGPLAGPGADLEGVARAGAGELYVSSEGDVKGGIAPWVGRFDAGGRLTGRLLLPDAFVPGEGRGVRRNAAFEALTLVAEHNLVAGTEGPLQQDEPAPAGELERTRILRWDLESERFPDQWAYPLDPPHARTPLPDGVEVRGLVDLLHWKLRFLALERSYVDGMGFAVKLYETTFAGAERLDGSAALGGRPVRTLSKRLVADFATLGVPLENYEGMTWAASGRAGEPLLVVVSDNNFNAPTGTHFLALAVDGEPGLAPHPLWIDRTTPPEPSVEVDGRR